MQQREPQPDRSYRPPQCAIKMDTTTAAAWIEPGGLSNLDVSTKCLRRLRLRPAERLAGHIHTTGGDLRSRPVLDLAVEGELHHHAARVVHEDLPQRGAGHDRRAPVVTELLDALETLVPALDGQADVIERRGAVRRLAVGAERRSAGINVNDRNLVA